MSTVSEYEDDNIPHVILTDDIDWDPTLLDNDDGDDIEWFDAQQEPVAGTTDGLETGDNVETMMSSNGEEVTSSNAASATDIAFVVDIKLYQNSHQDERDCQPQCCIKSRDWYHIGDGKPQPLSGLSFSTWNQFVMKIAVASNTMTRKKWCYFYAITVPSIALWVGMMSLPDYTYLSGEPIVDGNAPWYIATFCAYTVLLFGAFALYLRNDNRQRATQHKEAIASMNDDFQQEGFVVEYVVCRKWILGCPIAFGRFYRIISNDRN